MKRRILPLFGIPKLFPFIRPYGRTVFWMIVLGILSSLADTLFPLFNRFALDRFIAGNTLQGLGAFVAVYVILVVVQEFDNFYCLNRCGRIEMSIDRDLRNAAFNHLQTLSFSYFNQNHVGYIHARVMSDTAKIGDLVAWRMMEVVWDVSYIVWAIVMMLSVHAKLAGYVIIFVPIAAVVIALFQKKLVAMNHKIREINARITGNYNEGITGVRSIKALAIERRMSEAFHRETERMRRTSVRTAHHAALLASLVTLFTSIALALVLWKSGRISAEQVRLIGTLSVFVSYLIGLLDPIQNLITTFSTMIAIQVNIERFMQLLDERSDVADTQDVREKYGDNFCAKKENWETLHGDVEFRDVTFRYPDGEENVLEHFNMTIPHGTNVAIIGETGAGKSTLVNLVCRFYEPTQGQVLIDGRDARARSQLWLHSNIGYVLQQPHLFSGTVRDNLRYGKPDATDEEIYAALRLVSAEFVVEKMANGLDSEVGEGGDMLSTGEKQLLSFTRALLADPRILVLDEATSSIDSETEQAIQSAIETIIEGRTSFVIAHRLSTIVGADVILAVRDGRIVERGTHRELMKQRGYYYQLYRQQLQGGVV